MGCVFGGSGDARDTACDLLCTFGGFGYAAADFVGSDGLLFHGRSDAVADVVHLINDGPDLANGVDCTFGIGLDGLNLTADLFGGLGRLLRQFLNFIGDDGKAFARFTSASGFDGGVEGEQIGLLRD